MDDGGPWAATALLSVLEAALGQPCASCCLATGGSTGFDKDRGLSRLELLAETVQVFDKEKTVREGSCLMEHRAVPFQGVLLAC